MAAVELAIDTWLAGLRTTNPVIQAVDRNEPGDAERRWYVRMRGEDKDFTTVWLTIGQRTLRYETYVMPAPEEQHGEFYEHALRRNEKLVGAHFSIGGEDAVFLRGELPLVCPRPRHELDRIIGTLWAAVEQCFRPLLRIGFASRFSAADSPPDPPSPPPLASPAFASLLLATKVTDGVAFPAERVPDRCERVPDRVAGRSLPVEIDSGTHLRGRVGGRR